MFLAAGHDCATVTEAGFGGTTNGKLLAVIESLFDVLVTVDRNMRYQQSFADRAIALLVLCAHSNDFGDIERLVPDALAALKSIKPGQIVEISA